MTSTRHIYLDIDDDDWHAFRIRCLSRDTTVRRAISDMVINTIRREEARERKQLTERDALALGLKPPTKSPPAAQVIKRR